jgi:redox-sensitive bicupin YhaK (pirin superfamily)
MKQINMNQVLHRAETRGHAQHGWLDSHHSFSFGHYYDPDRINFGALRVLNDDVVAPGMGFGTHPHDNMEIVSIPLSGDLEHRDSMGNVRVIRQGDIQIMSAGTGVQHSEFNHNKDREVRFLQIWIFPKFRNIKPAYDQKTFSPDKRVNCLQEVVSPDKNENSIQINQDAWINLCSLTPEKKIEYKIHDEKNGVYLFLIDGEIKVQDIQMKRRDGLGLWNTPGITMESISQSEVLILEVPM